MKIMKNALRAGKAIIHRTVDGFYKVRYILDRADERVPNFESELRNNACSQNARRNTRFLILNSVIALYNACDFQRAGRIYVTYSFFLIFKIILVLFLIN